MSLEKIQGAREALTQSNMPAMKLAELTTKKVGFIVSASTAVLTLGISARDSIQTGVSSFCKKASNTKKSVTAFAKNHPNAVKVSAVVVAAGICGAVVVRSKQNAYHAKVAESLHEAFPGLQSEENIKLGQALKKSFPGPVASKSSILASIYKFVADFELYPVAAPVDTKAHRELPAEWMKTIGKTWRRQGFFGAFKQALKAAPVATPVDSEALEPTEANLIIAAGLRQTFAKPLVVLPKTSMANSVRGFFGFPTKASEALEPTEANLKFAKALKKTFAKPLVVLPKTSKATPVAPAAPKKAIPVAPKEASERLHIRIHNFKVADKVTDKVTETGLSNFKATEKVTRKATETGIGDLTVTDLELPPMV